MQQLIEHKFEDDTIEDFDELNNVYRNSYDWIKSNDNNFKSKQENLDIDEDKLNPSQVFKIISTPDEKNQKSVVLSGRYNSKIDDPQERLLSLKHELFECKKEIEEYAEIFKSNEYIKEKDNYSNLYNEIDTYKSKLDAFIDYEVFKNRDNSQASVEEDNGLKSNYEKNNILVNSLISQLKNIQDDMKDQILENNSSNKIENKTVSYEIIAAPEHQINIISSKVADLEGAISVLGKVIGEWSLVSILFVA